MPKTVIIIQARMSSTRLPGKILLPLGNKSVLATVVQRLRKCRLESDIIVATTALPADDKTVEECNNTGVKYFRGSSDNVLMRYYLAAKEAGADIIVRITSDCPFIDPQMLDNMLTQFKQEQADYLSNVMDRKFPRGFDMEIFTFKALEKSYLEAKLPYEQEHVTPYIYLNPDKFSLGSYAYEGSDNSDLRVTIDTEEDWEVIKNVYEGLQGKSDFSYIDVVNYLRKHPHIAEINRNIEQKKLGE